MTTICYDFYATWCNPCKQMKPFFHMLSDSYPSIQFIEIDIEDESEDVQKIVEQFKVTSLPTFVLVKDDVKIGQVVGADRTALVKMIQQL